MTENIALIFLGIILTAIGIMNIRGDISTIHWYNRRKVSEKDIPKYGFLMGLASVIIAAGLIITGMLLYFTKSELPYFIACIACVTGVVMMIYAQFKYNKGMF